MRALAPRSGHVRWTYTGATGVREVRVQPTDPAVITTAVGETGYAELLFVPVHGKVRATNRLQSGTHAGECSDEGGDRIVLAPAEGTWRGNRRGGTPVPPRPASRRRAVPGPGPHFPSPSGSSSPGAGSRSNSPSRAPSTKARHSASV